ncbi:MAG: FAD-dependent oxidoreductase [Pseudomonadota bacterium]
MFSILGGGVAGLSVASELVARGAAVQVFDPAGAPGAHACSWWAGGMLAPFCEYENAEEPVMRLGRDAAAWWGERTHVDRRGTLVVAQRRDRPDLRRFAQRTDHHRVLSAGEIAELEPDLSGFDHGLFFEDEAHLSPRRALEDLRIDLQEKGASFHECPAAEDLANVIDCRGYAARDTLPDLRGVKGEMLILRAPEIQITRPVRLLHPRLPLYIVPRGAGIYMLGATMIEAEDRRRVTARSLLELLSAAYALNPAFGEAEIVEIGVDLRPAFPDNLPKVRRVDQTIYANGLYRHGFLLAPALARCVADFALETKKTELFDDDHS